MVSSISYKFRLYPNAEQRRQLAVDFGVARWAWNIALDARSFCYRALGRSVSGVDCSRAITELKADPAYAWLKDPNSTVITQALRDQDRAFANFYAKRARAIGDVGLGELTRQLRYKSAWYGRDLFEIGQWTRTTGVCPDCGLIGQKLALSVRQWRCDCGAVHDRDVASAQVIKKVALGEGDVMRAEAGRSCLLAA